MHRQRESEFVRRQRFRGKRFTAGETLKQHAQGTPGVAQRDADVAVIQTAFTVVARDQNQSAGKKRRTRVAVEPGPQERVGETIDLIAAPRPLANERQQTKML